MNIIHRFVLFVTVAFFPREAHAHGRGHWRKHGSWRYGSWWTPEEHAGRCLLARNFEAEVSTHQTELQTVFGTVISKGGCGNPKRYSEMISKDHLARILSELADDLEEFHEKQMGAWNTLDSKKKRGCGRRRRKMENFIEWLREQSRATTLLSDADDEQTSQHLSDADEEQTSQCAADLMTRMSRMDRYASWKAEWKCKNVNETLVAAAGVLLGAVGGTGRVVRIHFSCRWGRRD